MLTEDSTVYHQISLNFKCVVVFHPGLRDYWIVLQTISHTAYIHIVHLNGEVQSHSIPNFRVVKFSCFIKIFSWPMISMKNFFLHSLV